MLELRELQPKDEVSFRAAVAECKNDLHNMEFAFNFDEQTDFKVYLERLDDWTKGVNLPGNFVPNTFFVGVVDGDVVGRLSLRHTLNDFLSEIGGHVGYAIVPSARGNGYATEMLKQSLPICAKIGIRKVLVTCDENNHGSIKVIEKCGGVFERTAKAEGAMELTRRYWIDLSNQDKHSL